MVGKWMVGKMSPVNIVYFKMFGVKRKEKMEAGEAEKATTS